MVFDSGEPIANNKNIKKQMVKNGRLLMFSNRQSSLIAVNGGSRQLEAVFVYLYMQELG